MQSNSNDMNLDNSQEFVLNELNLRGDGCCFSEIFYMNNNNNINTNPTETFNNAILSSKVSAHSDNDSDSGICSSSVSCHAGLSPQSNNSQLKIH